MPLGILVAMSCNCDGNEVVAVVKDETVCILTCIIEYPLTHEGCQLGLLHLLNKPRQSQACCHSWVIFCWQTAAAQRVQMMLCLDCNYAIALQI